MLYTLAALLPENEPVVSRYITCSPLIAAVTVAIIHNCTSTSWMVPVIVITECASNCQTTFVAAACMLV